MIAARQLTVLLAQRRIVEAVDLALGPGELVGLIGANGSGKSTLLRALAGLLPAASGGVFLRERPLEKIAPREIARALAYLPQNAQCYWPLQVERVVALGRLPHGDENAAAITRALAAVDALHLRARVITELSGGERARVFLARALAGEPELLFADEPTAGLDPRHQLQLMERLQSLARTGCGVLVVLHDLSLAARFCHRLLLLHEGRLVASGPPETVLSDALLAQTHGITLYRNRHEGEPVLLPWASLP